MVDVFVVGGWLEEGGAACWGSFYETAYSTIASKGLPLVGAVSMKLLTQQLLRKAFHSFRALFLCFERRFLVFERLSFVFERRSSNCCVSTYIVSAP